MRLSRVARLLKHHVAPWRRVATMEGSRGLEPTAVPRYAPSSTTPGPFAAALGQIRLRRRMPIIEKAAMSNSPPVVGSGTEEKVIRSIVIWGVSMDEVDWIN